MHITSNRKPLYFTHTFDLAQACRIHKDKGPKELWYLRWQFFRLCHLSKSWVTQLLWDQLLSFGTPDKLDWRKSRSVTHLKIHANIQPLKTRRTTQDLKPMYQTYHSMLKTNSSNCLNPKHYSSLRLHHKKTTDPYQTRINSSKYSFFCTRCGLVEQSSLGDYQLIIVAGHHYSLEYLYSSLTFFFC